MIKLPPLSKHDHPEPQTMVWSELEMQAIKSYAKQAVSDAIEMCARASDCRDLPATSAAIRALIKEIPE